MARRERVRPAEEARRTGRPMIKSQERVLADRLIPVQGWAGELLRLAAANLTLVLCARIAIPLPWTPVPITGQTFGLLLAAVALGSRRSAVVAALYLFEGAAGLPVFAFGAAGLAAFAGPTGGYLLAYPVAAFATGWLVERGGASRTWKLVGALLAGEAVIFAGGCAWLGAFLMASAHVPWTAALTEGALPFLPGELLKIALLVTAVRGVELARLRPAKRDYGGQARRG
jgi:biotin transport system substrate-specific component